VGSRIPRDAPCPADGRWLRKPLYSGGGRGIRFAHPREGTSPHQYFQDFIGGAPRSVAFSGTTLLGVTEQLIGEPWLHAKPFAYCGNVGPVSEAGPALARLLHLGRFLAGPCGLRAQWGIDFVLNGEVPYPVEVNPRYTAGMEVMEYGLGRSVFQQWVESGRAARGTVGKAIYYAPNDLTFPRSGPWYADLEGEFDPWRLPGFADIPAAGSRIEAGSPVLTFFATGSAPLEVRARLQSRAAELDLLFQEAQP
jgi:predicted ATP-grasp superfamily ATP-dependent carboligase